MRILCPAVVRVGGLLSLLRTKAQRPDDDQAGARQSSPARKSLAKRKRNPGSRPTWQESNAQLGPAAFAAIDQAGLDASVQGRGRGRQRVASCLDLAQASRACDQGSASAADSCLRYRVPEAESFAERRTSAINAAAHRHRGPGPVKPEFSLLPGERDGRVVQVAGMSFPREDALCKQ